MNQELELPVVSVRETRPQGFEIGLDLGDVSSDCAFGVPRAGFAPVQSLLVLRISNDGIKGGSVVHCRWSGM